MIPQSIIIVFTIYSGYHSSLLLSYLFSLKCLQNRVSTRALNPIKKSKKTINPPRKTLPLRAQTTYSQELVNSIQFNSILCSNWIELRLSKHLDPWFELNCLYNQINSILYYIFLFRTYIIEKMLLLSISRLSIYLKLYLLPRLWPQIPQVQNILFVLTLMRSM